MEQRVADVEECNADINEVLAYKLELQKSIQAQLTDLEALSHRNNICIHGIPEGAEGDNMKAFLEGLKKKKRADPPRHPSWYLTLPPLTWIQTTPRF